MPDLVDTNLLVRYLTGDPPAQSEAAARILDGEVPIAIAPLILVETAYVLRSVYGVSREDVVAALVDLVQRVNDPGPGCGDHPGGPGPGVVPGLRPGLLRRRPAVGPGPGPGPADLDLRQELPNGRRSDPEALRGVTPRP